MGTVAELQNMGIKFRALFVLLMIIKAMLVL